MAKRRHLPLRSAAMRFVATTAFAFSFYNPGGLHAVALLGSDALCLWPKLLVLTGYAAGALILGRLAWCGLDPFGRFVPLLLGVGVAALLVNFYLFAPGISKQRPAPSSRWCSAGCDEPLKTLGPRYLGDLRTGRSLAARGRDAALEDRPEDWLARSAARSALERGWPDPNHGDRRRPCGPGR